MPQTFPTTPESIYQALSDDVSFMENIGTYKFRNGATPISAISIVTPNQDLPGAEVTSGLECVIHDSTAVKRKQYLTGDLNYEIPWKVFLIVWPPATGGELMQATMRVLDIYPMAIANETIMIDTGMGALAQTQITIPSDGLKVG